MCEQRVSLILAAIPSAARTARRFADSVLATWDLEEAAFTVNLAVSELVTNAIKATGTLAADPARGWLDALISVCLHRQDGNVFVEVWDSGDEPPVMREPALDDESGRGMLLIQSITEACGHRRPECGGKIVWCKVAVSPR